MYTLELEARSESRHYVKFRGKETSYYSISIEAVSAAPSSLSDASSRFAIEVCEIERPDIMAFYTLKSRVYRQANEVPDYLANILVKYGAILEGTPLSISYTQSGVKHSWLTLNAGLEQAKRPSEVLQEYVFLAHHFISSYRLALSINDTSSALQEEQRLDDVITKHIVGEFLLNPFKKDQSEMLWSKCQDALARVW